MWRTRFGDGAEECPSWLHEAEWHALRTVSHCETAFLPIGYLPGFPRETGRALTEPAEGSYQGSSASTTRLGHESNRDEPPIHEISSQYAVREFRSHYGTGVQDCDAGTLNSGRT